MNDEFFESIGLQRRSSVDALMIANVERALGISLPPSYVALVLFNDEPMPMVNIVKYEAGETCVSEFLKFSDAIDEEFGVLAYAASRRGGPGHLVPFARDPGDWLLCFDAQAGNAVVLFDPVNAHIHRVASSFEQFLEELHD